MNIQIQKHNIFQFNVPFGHIATEDEIIFCRYLLINCFSLDNINYIRIEVEEIYESKYNPSPHKQMRTIHAIQFEEIELPGTLHLILNTLSKKEINGDTEITFILTLFIEILMNNKEIKEDIKKLFPKWNIDDLINELDAPRKLHELFKLQQEMK